MKIIKDVGIIGAGPAGMSAALYLARSKYSFLLIEKEMSGGKLNITTQIENYPGVGSIDGFTLGMNMRNQLKSFNISIKKDNCIDVKKVDEGFEVIGEKDTYLFILLDAEGLDVLGHDRAGGGQRGVVLRLGLELEISQPQHGDALEVAHQRMHIGVEGEWVISVPNQVFPRRSQKK